MSLIDKLILPKSWICYLNSKIDKDFVSNKEKEYIKDYILNNKYSFIAKQIVDNNYSFSIPKKHIISKRNTSKKRIVYTFNEDEMMILKMISYLLYDYDNLFSPNLYSFRKQAGVKNAVTNLIKIKNLSNMYGYKVDIQNYFNSIDTDILLHNLKKDIKDKKLFNILFEILSNKKVEYNDLIIEESKGVMAGIPISAFLANYYLKEIDEYFWKEKIVYIRYADDIIMFCNNKEELDKAKLHLENKLNEYKLSINKSKEYYINPNEKFDFLGFSINGKEIDLGKNTLNKIKGKIRRSARGIRRWMIKNNAKSVYALKAMNRKYNRKFFGNDLHNELSWKYWFFPSITTTKSLKIIDTYMQENLRYIVTGKHNKKNYEIVPYSLLKECNYRSLVNEYYK